MFLQDYRINVAKVSRRKAGAELGVHEITLWRYERGLTMPNKNICRRISEWSKGNVTASDLMAAVEAAGE